MPVSRECGRFRVQEFQGLGLVFRSLRVALTQQEIILLGVSPMSPSQCIACSPREVTGGAGQVVRCLP